MIWVFANYDMLNSYIYESSMPDDSYCNQTDIATISSYIEMT